MAYKNLLKALFKLSGSQAMPSLSPISVSLENGVGQQYYVAPADGWFRVSATTGATYLNVQDAVLSVGFTSVDPEAEHFLVQAIPVKKGVQIMIGGSYGAGSLLASFTPVVGGGVLKGFPSLVLAGGRVCLGTFCNCYLKVFCLARSLGSSNRRNLTEPKSRLIQSLIMGGIRLLSRAIAGFRLFKMVDPLASLMLKEELVQGFTNTATSWVDIGLMRRRDRHLTTCFRTTHPQASITVPTWVLPNLSVNELEVNNVA